MKKVGFIGMGIMGRAMSANVIKAGYQVMVYNRTPDKTVQLAELGAQVAGSPAEIAAYADTVIIMLTGPEAIDAVLEGADGILAAKPQGITLINMSSVYPAYTEVLNQKLAEQGIIFIDAPVSGSKKPAEEGTLIILAGGSQDKVSEAEPLLLTMGKKVVYCGQAGKGSAMKMAVNLLLGIMMEGLGEAAVFSQSCGVSIETFLDVVMSGPLKCGLYDLKTEMLKSDQYPPQFPLKHMAKDLRFAQLTAQQTGTEIPVGKTISQLYNQGESTGLADLDFAAVKKVLQNL